MIAKVIPGLDAQRVFISSDLGTVFKNQTVNKVKRKSVCDGLKTAVVNIIYLIIYLIARSMSKPKACKDPSKYLSLL